MTPSTRERVRMGAALIGSVALAVGYGLATQLAFRWDLNGALLGVMSLGFLFVMPVAVGVLTVAAAPSPYRTSWWYAALAPWSACFVLTLATIVFALDALICLVMALPLLLVMSSSGGVATCLLIRARWHGRPPHLAFVMLAVLAPYLWTPIEQRYVSPRSIRVVRTSVIVRADEASIWRNIARVPLINAAEQRANPWHWLGLPKPLEATLSYDGQGGVRHARFDNGLTFLETVTEWQPGRAIAFAIEIDRTAPMPAPMAAIGGRYFDVIDGKYWLEPLPDGTVRLHLESTERVSTKFNGYAGWWTDRIMTNLQEYILDIVRARAERDAAGAPLIVRSAVGTTSR